jgi:hypothetical protein
MRRIFKALFQRSSPKPAIAVPTAEKLFRACHAILHGEKRAFDVVVGRSKLAGAGYGLIIKEGGVKAGDVVALYSGMTQMCATTSQYRYEILLCTQATSIRRHQLGHFPLLMGSLR